MIDTNNTVSPVLSSNLLSLAKAANQKLNPSFLRHGFLVCRETKVEALITRICAILSHDSVIFSHIRSREELYFRELRVILAVAKAERVHPCKTARRARHAEKKRLKD